MMIVTHFNKNLKEKTMKYALLISIVLCQTLSGMFDELKKQGKTPASSNSAKSDITAESIDDSVQTLIADLKKQYENEGNYMTFAPEDLKRSYFEHGIYVRKYNPLVTAAFTNLIKCKNIALINALHATCLKKKDLLLTPEITQLIAPFVN